ncbi:MAG TPA: hypothetical protein PKY30_20795, partial [Myxococcota bacterium]|nr:hypothetical protein [Myxococcota bacterium]
SQIDSTAIFVDFLLRRIFMQAKFKSPNWEIRGITFCGEKKQLPSGGVVRTKCRYVEGGGRLRSLKYVTYPHGYDYPLSHFCT